MTDRVAGLTRLDSNCRSRFQFAANSLAKCILRSFLPIGATECATFHLTNYYQFYFIKVRLPFRNYMTENFESTDEWTFPKETIMLSPKIHGRIIVNSVAVNSA